MSLAPQIKGTRFREPPARWRPRVQAGPEAVLGALAGTLDHGPRSPWTPPGQDGRGWRGAACRLGKATRGIPMTQRSRKGACEIFRVPRRGDRFGWRSGIGRVGVHPLPLLSPPSPRRTFRFKIIRPVLNSPSPSFAPLTEAHRQGRSPVKGGVHLGIAHTPVRAIPRWTGPVDRESLGRSAPHSVKNTAPTRVNAFRERSKIF